MLPSGLRPALESAGRKLKIGNLKARLERCRTLRVSLGRELNNSELASEGEAASIVRCDGLRSTPFSLHLNCRKGRIAKSLNRIRATPLSTQGKPTTRRAALSKARN